MRESVHGKLGHPRWNVIEAGSGAGALEVLHQHEDGDGVLLLDPMLPDLDPDEFHGMIKRRFPHTQVVTLNARTGQMQADDGATTPVSKWLMELVNVDGVAGGDGRGIREAEMLPRLQKEKNNLRGMVGNSEPMQRAYELARMVAARDTTVLVTGESGTGKDLVAQEIHQISPRRKQPFVVVNCSAIPEALLEAELFGYAKGAFTGAVQSRIGRIHAAHGGTLFLDEIGDMPLSLQGKMLRFLEQGEVQRLGGNRQFEGGCAGGRGYQCAFETADWEAVVSRRSVLPAGDFSHPAAAAAGADGRPRGPGGDVSRPVWAGKCLSYEALRILAKHDWPGNVRELRNVMERATILVGSGREIGPNTFFCSARFLWSGIFCGAWRVMRCLSSSLATIVHIGIGKCCPVLMWFQ